MYIEPFRTAAGRGLNCWACGARTVLAERVPFSQAARSFLAEHRDCQLTQRPGIPVPRAALSVSPDQVVRVISLDQREEQEQLRDAYVLRLVDPPTLDLTKPLVVQIRERLARAAVRP